ncbi:centrosomal P4.1-associated protein [Eucyclogobius newberryi]|uniref:centrosomal P4.1-associated protein n=1 Tax=Eucyclogobius newberryi TaxID=166745 RepID=UPI003B5A2483
MARAASGADAASMARASSGADAASMARAARAEKLQVFGRHKEEQLQTQSNGSSLSAQQHEGETPAGDRPIRPGTRAQRTFEEMLEEQLREEETRLKSVNPSQNDPGADIPQLLPRRAFLRRGVGLMRFTSRKADVHKNSRPPAQAKAVICCSAEPISVHKESSCAPKPPVQRKTASVFQEHRSTTSLVPKADHFKVSQSHLPLHTPQTQTVQGLNEGAASRRPAEPTSCGSRAAEASRPQGPQGDARSSQEWSFQERLLHLESVGQEESVELGEFELLEQAAEELSFSSNSSFVLKVLQMDQQKQLQAEGPHQRRFSSTPVKSPPDLPEPISLRGLTDVEPQQGHRQGHRQGQSQGLRESQADPAEQVPPSPGVYTFPCQRQSPYNMHTYEDQSLTPSDAADSDSDREDVTITEHPPETSRVLFDDRDTWSQLSQEHSFTTDSPGEPGSPAECAITRKVSVSRAVEQEAPPDGSPPSQLMSQLFPALNTHSHNAPVITPLTAAESQSALPHTLSQQAQPQLLRERLAELEVQIELFKKENAALAKLRKDNHRVQEELRRERSEFEQMKAQERSSFEEYKRKESQKLQRERKLLEKHMSAARAVPNKSEREEIQVLKQQLSSVQDELRNKERRWTNAHSRLDQQLHTLREDNRALHKEVKMLEKLRITTWKRNSIDEDKTPVAKGVKFACAQTPLYCPPALATRGSRRASAPGGTVGTKGIKSSLRRTSLTVGTVQENEPEEQNQSSLSPKEAPGCSLDDTLSEPHPAQDCERRLHKEVLLCELGVPAQAAQAAQVAQVAQASSGGRLIVFPNGTKKEVSCDGQTLKITFFNGDTKEMTADQRVIYYYAEAKTTHITYPDGMEVLHFPNNQTEKLFPDGRKEITFSDQTLKNLFPDGREESVLTDGTIIQLHPDGRKEILFISGQREVHTAQYKRREYPDGTVKTLFSDGRQETCYATGRVRIKDKEGNVILDTP